MALNLINALPVGPIEKAPVGWVAIYCTRDGEARIACDARGKFIWCDTRELALSVAKYRRRRLRRWR